MVENYYPIEFDETGANFTIVNNGTAPAPCVITFIPKVDFIRLEIKGLSKERHQGQGVPRERFG